MHVDFRVENALDTHVATKAIVDGEEQMVTAAGFEVELVPVQARHGSLRLSFVGKEVAEAKEKFKSGETVCFNV